MATATKKKTGRKPAKKKTGRRPAGKVLVQFPVKCGNVSIGDKTVSVGVKIDRQFCSLQRMEECLVGRRITGRLKLGNVAATDAPRQQTLENMDDSNYEVVGVFQTSSVSVTDKTLGVTLNLNMKEIEEGALDRFAKKAAGLIIEQVDTVKAGDDEDDIDPDPADEEGDDE
jgi:hypothetical protein